MIEEVSSELRLEQPGEVLVRLRAFRRIVRLQALAGLADEGKTVSVADKSDDETLSPVRPTAAD